MDNRLKFLYWVVSIKTLRGDGVGITLPWAILRVIEGESKGLSSKVVDNGKSVSNPIFYLDYPDSASLSGYKVELWWRKKVIFCFQENPRKGAQFNRTKTDTGGRVEYTKAIGRTILKELGKLARRNLLEMSWLRCKSEPTTKDAKRLFNKNTAPC